MLEFIDRLRQKPEHVRRRIAAGTAVTLTGIIALGWMGALIAGNAFILTPNNNAPSLAESGAELGNAVKQRPSGFNQLMGAVGASGEEENASLIIVEGREQSTIEETAPEERTSISF